MDENTTHSPGPWQAYDTKEGITITGPDPLDPTLICTVPKRRPGDAQLIVAAPDLLAACKAVEAMSGIEREYGGHADDLVRAAIAKAEDRQ